MNDVAARTTGTGLANREAFLANLNKMASSIVVKGGDYQYLRLDKNDGVWNYGTEGQEIDPKGLWAINPLSFQHGYIAWHQSMPEDEVLMPIARDLPAVDSLPPVKAKNGWEEQLAVELVAISGKDAGVKALYKASTIGSKKFFASLTNDVFTAGKAGDEFVPVVRLSSSSYENKKHGGTNWNPLYEVVEWRTLDNAAPPEAAKAAEPKAEAKQPDADKAMEEEYAEAAQAAEAQVPRRRQRRSA